MRDLHTLRLTCGSRRIHDCADVFEAAWGGVVGIGLSKLQEPVPQRYGHPCFCRSLQPYRLIHYTSGCRLHSLFQAARIGFDAAALVGSGTVLALFKIATEKPAKISSTVQAGAVLASKWY